MSSSVPSSVDAVEESLTALLLKYPEAESFVHAMRIEWRGAQRKIKSLEMVIANEKREIFEDPLVIHEMHVLPPPRPVVNPGA